MEDYGFVRWAKLTIRKDAIIKPRVTLEVIGGETPEGLLKTRRVSFEAPDGDGQNVLTPTGVKGVTIDASAFKGLVPGMLRVIDSKFIGFDDEGKPQETTFDEASYAEVRIKIDAMVNLKSLAGNVRQAQKRLPDGGFVPLVPRKVTVKVKDEEVMAIREFYTLIRGGAIELAPLGSFRASNDNVLKLS